MGKRKEVLVYLFGAQFQLRIFIFYFFPKGDKRNKKDIEILLLIEIWLETDVMSTVEY